MVVLDYPILLFRGEKGRCVEELILLLHRFAIRLTLPISFTIIEMWPSKFPSNVYVVEIGRIVRLLYQGHVK